MTRKYEQPEDEINDSLPYIENRLSALMFYTYKLLKHKYRHIPEVVETIDSFRDLEALFSHFDIKSIEELKKVLEISQNQLKIIKFLETGPSHWEYVQFMDHL